MEAGLLGGLLMKVMYGMYYAARSQSRLFLFPRWLCSAFHFCVTPSSFLTCLKFPQILTFFPVNLSTHSQHGTF